MKIRGSYALLFLALGASSLLRAQGWDPGRQAKGWAYQDVDGSMYFYDAGSRSLRQWQKGGGLLSSQSLPLPEPPRRTRPKPEPAPRPTSGSDYEEARALLYGIPSGQRTRTRPAKAAAKEDTEVPATCDAVPDRWVLDTFNRIWVVCEGRLVRIDTDGHLGATYTLPGPVEDFAVGREALYLNYRTLKPYVEKRSLQDGDVVWTYGDKTTLKEVADTPLLVPRNRMAVRPDGTVYLAEGGALLFTVLDGKEGPKAPGQCFFTTHGNVASRVNLGRYGRGPMLLWAGRDVVFSAFDGPQLKGTGAPESKNVVLARFDLAKGTLDWIPTPLTEGHELVGLLEHEAVFLNPEGGLSYAPIH